MKIVHVRSPTKYLILVHFFSLDLFYCVLYFTGKEMQTVTFPAKRITSCCFGGPNYDEMFVTCAKTGLSEEEFKNEQPLAGSVFKVTGLGVKGLPPTAYSG